MIYPSDIIEPLKRRISKVTDRHFKPPTLPPDSILKELLEIAYQASLLTEEGRKLHFRIIYASQADICERPTLQEHLSSRPIVFNAPRDFSVAEVLRLAPALDMTQVLICVSKTNRSAKLPKLGIWGLLDSGSSWWHFMHHESSHGMPPPNHLTLSCTEPGQISISFEGFVIMSLRGGQLVEPIWDALYEGPLSDFFKPAQLAFHRDVITELKSTKYDEEGHDEDYPKRFYTFFIERLLFHIREKAHGGTVFFVPDYLTHSDTRLLDRASIKYPINYDVVWSLLRSHVVTHRRYFDLYFPLSDGKQLSKENFNTAMMLEGQRERIEEATSDCVRFIAGLSGVDGAIIITDKFRVLGFGAEVLVHSPNLSDVLLPGKKRKGISDFGTRHRSAFRFCSSLEESIGFIVSSDGGVKAAMRTGSDVSLWPDINVGGFGI